MHEIHGQIHSQLLSDNNFVGPCPPIIIGLPYDDPPPLVAMLVARQLPTNNILMFKC